MVEPVDDGRDELEAMEQPTRRGFLGISALLAGLMGAMLAGPAIPFCAAPLFRKEEDAEWVPLGDAAEFGEERQERTFETTRQDGWYEAKETRRVVVGQDSGEWVVLSTRCSHLGCGVTWMPDEQKFFCPCHAGEFNADGSVKKGPPKKPLARLQARVNPETGQLEVRES